MLSDSEVLPTCVGFKRVRVSGVQVDLLVLINDCYLWAGGKQEVWQTVLN